MYCHLSINFIERLLHKVQFGEVRGVYVMLWLNGDLTKVIDRGGQAYKSSKYVAGSAVTQNNIYNVMRKVAT